MLGFPNYLWRLLPANPILLRVVETGGKRTRDLIIRCIYLGALVLLVLFSLGNTDTGSLSQLTIRSTEIFAKLSTFQLVLVALLAPIFTAGAITQEKDSQTYDILLATPLSNGQVVLGSLLSRLFFVFALLLSGIPIFSITQVFGGVAIGDIVLSVLISAVTALITGSLAIAIATFKVGTRRTIFSFYLFNVLYLVGLHLLDQVSSLWVPLDNAVVLAPGARPIGWLTPFHPFLALQSVLDPIHYVTPSLSQLPEGLRGWPVGWMLTHPVAFYLLFTTLLSMLLVSPSILLLRRMAQSTTTLQSTLLKWIPVVNRERARKPRTVWHNPIAWREAKTKASASRATFIRLAFILAGMIGAIILLVRFSTEAGVPRYFVDRGSYDAGTATVFIHNDPQKTFLTNDRTVVMLDGNEVDRSYLNGRYEVESKGQATINGSKVINSIRLRTIERMMSAKDVRTFLLGIILVEVTAILLIITNAAASTVTREKEDGTLDLLLATPITSRYYIWGKINGLISFVLPLLTVPVASCAVFVVYDLFRALRSPTPIDWIVLPESILLIPAMLVVVLAFASLVGMHMSLRCRTTVWAVMSSVGIMLGVCGVLTWCGNSILSNMRFESGYAAIAAFSPFTMLWLLITPGSIIGEIGSGGTLDAGARIALFIAAAVAICAYGAIVYAMYTSMVKNFDMTIRKQSR